MDPQGCCRNMIAAEIWVKIGNKNQDGLRLSNMTRICDPPSLQFCIPLLLMLLLLLLMMILAVVMFDCDDAAQ